MKQIYENGSGIYRMNANAKEEAEKMDSWTTNDLRCSEYGLFKQGNSYFLGCVGHYQGDRWALIKITKEEAEELSEEADYFFVANWYDMKTE